LMLRAPLAYLMSSASRSFSVSSSWLAESLFWSSGWGRAVRDLRAAVALFRARGERCVPAIRFVEGCGHCAAAGRESPSQLAVGLPVSAVPCCAGCCGGSAC
jgi:hypothetical protein